MADNNVRELRNEKGLSRAELSRLSQIPIRTLECWEADEASASHRVPRDVYQIKKVADALGVRIEEVINFDE